MLKTRIYFLQFLGIVLLLCCSMLRDQPDRLSMMHFDSSSKSVIKNDRSNDVDYIADVAATPHSDRHGHKHKPSRIKHVSFDLILPVHHSTSIFEPTPVVCYTCMLPDSYTYLFYAEINPPPPKC